ncbi:hypothetical protein BCR44DRAFT_1037801 [Catenaria anguillulae PL171]|uniref:Uncharacterized protein n=1 Tax=Catenaria anguillulae PL171 TaxID=765915 RepID=A0A1Y2HA02_9FUNG|nr:hypothetical protein BCR44DRAFT_1037801 [Catenaria anguillulae PL171]
MCMAHLKGLPADASFDRAGIVGVLLRLFIGPNEMSLWSDRSISHPSFQHPKTLEIALDLESTQAELFLPCATNHPELHNIVSLLDGNSVSLIDIASHSFFSSRSRSALRNVGHNMQMEFERRMAVAEARAAASASKTSKRKAADGQAGKSLRNAAEEHMSPRNK